MKIIKKVTEDEVLLSFLKGEINSDRFGNDLRGAAEKLDIDLSVILNGDISSDEQNRSRKQIMREYRGYPDKEIFENFPSVVDWVYGVFEKNDLDKTRYIDYSYWNALSDFTSCPSAAAKNILAGKEIFGVSNRYFFDAARSLDNSPFPPIILLSCNDKYLAIEGHRRLTAYALRPDKFEGAYGYIGLCSEEDMRKKEPKTV